jgi:hypothetical protein
MAEEIKKEKFGPAAFNKETGRWHHVSASLLSKFEDCRRMPYFAKILKLPQVYTKQQKLGTEMHEHSDHLVKTGQDLFGDRLKGLRKFYPEVLPDPLAFAEIGTDGRPHKKGEFDYSLAPQLLDIPMEGYLDLLFLNGALPKIRDLKTRGKLFTDEDGEGYALTPEQLKEDLQLGLYAWWVTLENPGPVDVGHLYAQTKGPILTDEVQVLLTPDDIYNTVSRAEDLVRGLKELEGVKDARDIAPTGQAKGYCHRYYGRQCDFLATCQRTPAARLREHLLAASTFGGGNLFEGSASNAVPGEKSMTILEKIRLANQNSQASGTPAAGASPVQQAAPAQPQGPQTSAAATVPAPGIVPPAPSNADDPEVKAALPEGGSVQPMPDGSRLLFNAAGDCIKKLGPRKLPIADVGPQTPDPLPGAPGSRTGEHPGKLEATAPAQPPQAPVQQTLISPKELEHARALIAAASAQQIAGPAANQILPPDAPPNDANAVPAPKGRKKKDSPISQDAAPSNVGVAPAAPVAESRAPGVVSKPQTEGPPQDDSGAAKGGETPGPSVPSASPATGSTSPGELLQTEAQRAYVAPGAKLPIHLYVNCFPVSEGKAGFEFLDYYVAARVAKVCELLQVVDFRITERGAISGRGALAAEVRAAPPTMGTYVAMVSGFDSPMQTVVETLIPMAEVVVRGAR